MIKIGKKYYHTEETKAKMSLTAKGKKKTEEHKQKLSLALKGNIPWNNGIPCTERTKQKISAACKGRKTSKETRVKLSEARKNRPNGMTGKVLTEKHKQRISEANKGRPAWNKGIPSFKRGVHLSKETKLKISIANKGKKHTKEAKEKIGIASRQRIQDSYIIGLNRSKPEIEFGKQIEKYFGISLQDSKWLDGRVFDFCYSPKKILFECDGRYWHSRPDRIVIDKEKNEIAKRYGYVLIRYILDSVKDVVPLIQHHYDELKSLLNNNM